MLLTVSRRLQRMAQPLLTRQALFNGFGYPFIIEAVIILLALHYGASDLQMGFIFAAPHLTGFAAVFAPRLLHGVDMSVIWSRMWWTRGFLAVLYLLIPLVPGISGDTRVWLVILALYLVGVARALGMTVYVPVIKALTPPREIASTMARVMTATQTGTLLCRVTAFFWLGSGLLSEHLALLSLIVLGIISNSYTATVVGKLPATGEMDGASVKGVFQVLAELARKRATRRVAVLTLVQTAMFIFAGYTVSYCSKVMQFDGTRIFLLMLCGSVVSIAATYVVKIVGERITTRLQLLLATMLSGACALLWAVPGLLPGSGSFWFYFALFPLTGVGASVAATKLMALQSEYLPKNSAARVAIAFQVLTLAGGLASLGLVQIMQTDERSWIAQHLHLLPGGSNTHAYSGLFLTWALAAGLVWLIVRSLPRHAERPLHEELSLLLPQNLYDLYRTYSLSRYDVGGLRGRGRLVLEGVMLNASALSKNLLRESLHTSEVSRRYSALRMLVCRPQEDVLPEVLAEAADAQSPLRYEALTALGFMECKEALPLLRQLSDDPDPMTASGALKSLLRLGDEVPFEQVLAVWRRCPSNHVRWGLAAGLADADRLCALLGLLNLELPATTSPTWAAMLLQMTAEVRDTKADMVDVLDAERERHGAGLELALAEWEGELEERLPAQTIRQAWAAGDLRALAQPLTNLCRWSDASCCDDEPLPMSVSLDSPKETRAAARAGGRDSGNQPAAGVGSPLANAGVGALASGGNSATDGVGGTSAEPEIARDALRLSQRLSWWRGRRGLRGLEWENLLGDRSTAAGLLFLVCVLYRSRDAN